MFKKEFMPEQWQKNKRVEFINLKQGEMKVVDYHSAFIKLSRWYKGPPEQKMEDMKQMFLDGLRAHIQIGVTSCDMATLADINAATLRAKQLKDVRKGLHQAWSEEKKRKAVSSWSQ